MDANINFREILGTGSRRQVARDKVCKRMKRKQNKRERSHKERALRMTRAAPRPVHSATVAIKKW